MAKKAYTVIRQIRIKNKLQPAGSVISCEEKDLAGIEHCVEEGKKAEASAGEEK